MNRVRLTGGLERTASSAYVNTEGGIVVECFDFSQDAHDFFGNDVAFSLTIDAELKTAVLEGLGIAHPDDDVDAAILSALADRFASYYAVKQWLEEQQIAFSTAFEPHA
jgi:hypothetical protein